MEWLEDTIDFSQYLKDSDAKINILPASDFSSSLKNLIRESRTGRRIYLPWSKTCDNFNFRSGETTIWAGQNGHGKSLITSQVMLSLIGQGQRVCVASLEMKPEQTLLRMARMFTGSNPMSPAYQSNYELVDDLIDQFIEWSGKNLWIYRQTGNVETDAILGVAKYAGKELHCDHFFVDNLAKCVRNEDDYNGQKYFIERIFALGKDTNTHMHVVHHLKKGEKEDSKPDKAHVKGSGAIVDQPDNLFLVWRNKKKEESTQQGDYSRENEPDAVLYCKKNRNHDGIGIDEPMILLHYDRESMQFVGSKGERIMEFFKAYPH